MTAKDGQFSGSIQAAVFAYALHFPGRVRSIYLEGSFAIDAQVATSDVDLVVVFKDQFAGDAEEDRANEIAGDLAGSSPLELDISVVDEAGLQKTGLPPSLKLSSRLASGEDIREKYALVPIQRWGRERMHAAYWLTTKVFERPEAVSLPLDFPDPQDAFYGYTKRTVQLSDGRVVPTTRNLIRVTGWQATALLAHLAGKYVANKKDCAALYSETFRDEWAAFHSELYQRCRHEWNYLIPESGAGRQALRSLCRQTLGFENHFLSAYKTFVLQELRSGAAERSGQALWVLDQIPFHDPEILADVAALGGEAVRVHP